MISDFFPDGKNTLATTDNLKKIALLSQAEFVGIEALANKVDTETVSAIDTRLKAVETSLGGVYECDHADLEDIVS